MALWVMRSASRGQPSRGAASHGTARRPRSRSLVRTRAWASRSCTRRMSSAHANCSRRGGAARRGASATPPGIRRSQGIPPAPRGYPRHGATRRRFAIHARGILPWSDSLSAAPKGFADRAEDPARPISPRVAKRWLPTSRPPTSPASHAASESRLHSSSNSQAAPIARRSMRARATPARYSCVDRAIAMPEARPR